ncbi:MAG: hypothetical protein COT74_00675 [Bdellovibrionales bacterium CG10_big_fil_rev_8_21_14_0_10_45_34]|nr:MAG: hypothetical protein COT74_00675 [Bdellovibrionales bacterium CG10_big_fil_rev_8_21_14_0_10_45_34]
MTKRRAIWISLVLLIFATVVWRTFGHSLGHFMGISQTPQSDVEKRNLINNMLSDYQKALGEIPSVEADQVNLISTKVTILDVRTEKEMDTSRIENSISVAEFEQQSEKYKNNEIIVYCTIGYRSGLAAIDLRRKGFNAFSLRGGILLWAHSGKQLWSQGKPVKVAHIYGAEWNLLPHDWKAIW